MISIGRIAFTAELPSSALIQPDALVTILQTNTGAKPLIIQVGFQKLYQQAHIPGSEYIGAGSDGEGIQKLKKRVTTLPKDTAIVLYCGCCPWGHCPNVQPAYQALHAMGYTNVKVLYIAQNFGADWVSKGYPTEKGE
jgi:rhodanese-related sulfurtransferase